MHRYTLSYFVDSIVVLLLFACLLYSHEYDKCGRVTRITHDNAEGEEQTYSYYSSGRLQEAKNEHALVRLVNSVKKRDRKQTLKEAQN